jgi:hypothetical protein
MSPVPEVLFSEPIRFVSSRLDHKSAFSFTILRQDVINDRIRALWMPINGSSKADAPTAKGTLAA